MDKKNQYIISVMSADRVGIIHDITKTLSALEGDLTDTRQQVLRGYFSMILYGSFPDTVSAEAIHRHLLNIDRKHPLEVSIRPVVADDSRNISSPDDSYVLTARGADRIGFVALVSGFCADHGINILDLSTTGRGATYTMILLVDLSGCSSLGNLRDHLDQFSREHGLSLLLQHHDIFKATNEIRMI